MKKIKHYSIKVLKIVLIILLVGFLAMYGYFYANEKKIIAQITQQLSEKINGDIKIKNVEISFFKTFPRIAVYVQDISVTDTMFSIHQHPFFQAKEVFINLSIFKLIKSQPALSKLIIRNGAVYLFTDSLGYTNKYLLESKKDPQGGPKKTDKNISLNSILLQSTHIIFQDDQKGKLYDFDVQHLKLNLDDENEILVIDADANLVVNSLTFNMAKGSFLKGAGFSGRFELQYGKKSQVFSFKEITVKLSGQPFLLSGTFDLGDKNPGFTLKAKTSAVLYEDVKKLLPRRIDSALSIAAVDKPLDAAVEIYGPLKGGEPYILAKWAVKNANLKTNFMDFENASFTGYYNNEVTKGRPRKDSNSIISLSDFTGEWHGLPINSGSIKILDLQKPQLVCDLHSIFPLTSLNELLQSGSLQLTAGNAEVLLTYSGPIERNNNSNSFLNGTINFKNGKILYTPRNVLMTDVNGALSFKNSNLLIENIRCKVFGNEIIMNGTANNALTLISTEPNKVSVNYNIYSPSLNLTPFTVLLQSRKQVSSAGKNQFGKLAAQIDEMLEKSLVNVELKADQLLYNKVNGSNLEANITVLQDRYLLNNVKMSMADGSIAMKGGLITIANGRHRANLSANLQNVNVKKIFYEVDNFGQNAITDKNLEGKLTATANVNIEISGDGKVIPSTSEGVVDFSLKKGALNDFAPIQKIQNFIFKKRNFENIQFAELKNKLTINRGEININRMEIQSTVLSFFVQGLYSQKGNTDISVQVPLSNLKERDSNYIPKNTGTDKKGGRSIFLRGRPGKDGYIEFKLDLFNKYKKENGVDTTYKE